MINAEGAGGAVAGLTHYRLTSRVWTLDDIVALLDYRLPE